MMKFTCLLTMLLFWFCGAVIAHDGHDHSSSWAFLFHISWLAPMMAAVYLVIKYRSFLTKKTSNKS